MLDLPESDHREYLGTDRRGGYWLLKWSVPGAPDVWSATGYGPAGPIAFTVDAEGYCIDGLTNRRREKIIHARPLHHGEFIPVTRGVLAKRFRALSK